MALCEGALYVGAPHADMYYQMSFGTRAPAIEGKD